MKVHDVVALMRNIGENGLIMGRVGTIIRQWQEGVHEVEFANPDGWTYALVASPEVPEWRGLLVSARDCQLGGSQSVGRHTPAAGLVGMTEEESLSRLEAMLPPDGKGAGG